jgi:AcrR family transcriptional regulator
VESAVQTPRRYRGITAAERRAARRERLMDAGLEVFGTEGYAGSSIRGVSAAAGLNSRYFYESFGSREELLYEVYLKVISEIIGRATDAIAVATTVEEQARAGLRAGWTVLTEDRRKGRIVALEVVGVSDRIERARRDMRHAMAEMTVRNALSFVGEDAELRLDPRLTARALMGGVVDVLVDWIHGEVDASVDEVVEHFTQLFTAAAYAAIEAPPRQR